MKKISVILGCLFNIVCCYAAPGIHFYYQRNMELRIEADKSMAYAMYKDVIYYTESRLDKENSNDGKTVNHCVYTRNVVTGKTDSFNLVFPMSATASGFSAYDLALNDGYIALTFDSLYLFDNKGSDKDKYFIRTIPCGFHCDKVAFAANDCLFIYKNYNNHPKDDSVNTRFFLYDIKNDKVLKSSQPVFNHISYSHLVSHFVDVRNGQIAFAQTMPYEISIMSAKDMRQEALIKGEPFNNNEGTMRRIDSLEQNAYTAVGIKEVLYAIRKEDSVVRIEKIYMLGDDRLLVTKTIPGAKWEKRTIDVWERKYNRWQRIVTDQIYETEKSGDYNITGDLLPLNLTYSNKLLIGNGRIYLINSKVGPEKGIKTSDYLKNMDGYYENNALNYYVWEYTWDIK